MNGSPDRTQQSSGQYEPVAGSGFRQTRPAPVSDQVATFYQDHCVYLPAMAGWFLFSALLSSYNKIVFGDKNVNFPCPLLLTSVHFGAQWIFSYLACKMFPETFGAKRVTEMTWSEFLSVGIPCGLVTSGDVGLSNLSMVTSTYDI